MGAIEKVSLKEIVTLAAEDSIFYSHHFFPKTARQESPPIHAQMWALLEDPSARFVNIQAFRGSAKTTILRLLASKRVAYGISRTILYIGKSEGHAIRSLDWLRRQVLYNTLWTTTYGLTKGDKFQGTEAEIRHHSLDHSIWLIAAGIEGSIRGVNLDDWRPDLIILDDVIADENASTPEGRNKLNELIFGALKESLAPASEAPEAMMVMLNTPIDREDASVLALNDPEFHSLRVGCWTKSTEDLALEERESVWAERWSSEELRKEKIFAIKRGQVHIFNREKECKITDPDTSPLKSSWLQYWDLAPERREFNAVIMSIDPVPKPTPNQIAKNLHGKDWEVMQVWGRARGKIFLLDRARNRGHDPSWSRTEFMRLATKWRILKARVDSRAYQSTLSFILKEEMHRQGRFFVIEEVTGDNRSKFHKIVDTFSGPGSEGVIYIPPDYREFAEQWSQYPNVAHDDDLDCGHLAVEELQFGNIIEGEAYEVFEDLEREIPALNYERACP